MVIYVNFKLFILFKNKNFPSSFNLKTFDLYLR